MQTIAAIIVASVVAVAAAVVTTIVVMRRSRKPDDAAAFNARFKPRREPGTTPYERANDLFNPAIPDPQKQAQRIAAQDAEIAALKARLDGYESGGGPNASPPPTSPTPTPTATGPGTGSAGPTTASATLADRIRNAPLP